MTGQPATDAQISYVRGIQKRLHLPDTLLDKHCVTRFKAPFEQLDRGQVSELLNDMVAWQELPAEFQRAKGQQDLPGFGTA
jgi:hypothetical protein